MGAQSNILKWARQLTSKVPSVGAHIRRSACRKLASEQTAEAVPFLISALAGSDEVIRRIADEGLRSLESPQAVEVLHLGYVFTGDDTLRQILASLGRNLPDTPQAPAGPSQDAMPPTKAEQAWRFHNDRDGTVLAFVPEGDFLAGKEGFRVSLPPYYLAITAVTNVQYAEFLQKQQPNSAKLAKWVELKPSGAIRKENDAYTAEPEKADFPVIWVTREGADAYCKWAGLRLPTELEWEKGARGTDGRLYPWGDEWDEGRPSPTSGEQKPEEITSVLAYPSARSPYGLYQMIGNVYEWCADWYEEDAYKRYAQGDLRPPPRGEHRVLRGGSWRYGTPVHLRTEYRKSTAWRGGTFLCSFRCAKSL